MSRAASVSWRILAMLLLAALAPAGLTAQFTEPRAGAGVRFESYSFSDSEDIDLEQIQLLTVPVSARALLGSRFELGVGGAYARGTARRGDGEENELAGLTDIEVRLTARLAGDRLRLGVVGLLPTGVTELSTRELDVAGLIAADVLPFAISNWGSGGGVGVSAAGALPVAPGTSLGFSAGYVLAQEYEPLAEGQFNYRPGNQLHLRAAVDHMVGSAAKAALALSYQQFSADQGDGTNLYQSGDRLQALASLAFAAGARASGIAWAGYLRRLEGEYVAIAGVTPTQDLVYAGTSFRQPLRGLVLTPSAELRVLGSDDGVDQGYTFTAGAGLEVPAGRLEVVPTARFRFGHITVRENRESNYTGLDLGLTLRNRAVTQ